MQTIQYTIDSSGITDVPGFECGAATCDIKGSSDCRLDLALVYSSSPCTAAGVFTKNDLKSPTISVCQEHLQTASKFHAIIVNSGNANACTGTQGLSDAQEMTKATAAALQVEPESVFVCSTGRIGLFLPMQKILPGIAEAAAKKSNKPEAGNHAAQAILTSDTCTKSTTARFTCDGQTITLAVTAKGAGMISPNMATMLVFLATDAQVAQPLLKRLLIEAVDQSFNRITVDGDMSTNDTVLILANGESEVKIPDDAGSPLYQHFAEALKQICAVTAEKVITDGERITKVIEVNVCGAPSDEAADKAARAIANSLLVKSSWYGGDPNWGRIAHAVGYAGVGLVEEKLDITYHSRMLPEGMPVEMAKDFGPLASTKVLEMGKPLLENTDAWKTIVSRKHFAVTVDMHLGEGRQSLLTTDLSEAYVDFNKSEK